MSEMQKYRLYYLNDFSNEYDAFSQADPNGDWYRGDEVEARLALKDAAIAKLGDNIGELIGENNDYMESCSEKDARLDAEAARIAELEAALEIATQINNDHVEREQRMQRAIEWCLQNCACLSESGQIYDSACDEIIEVPPDLQPFIRPAREESK